MRVSAALGRIFRSVAGIRKSRRRTAVGLGTIGIVAALVAVPAFGVLAGSPSKFESDDGDMVLTTTGNKDWANVSFNATTDKVSGEGDDSFTSGQKQDTTCPGVEPHNNPPKDDFSDVAQFSETNGTTKKTYLYGATIRTAANGNASENVELKQGDAADCGNGLFERQAGDKLIAIDYLNGGTNVDFHVLTWITDTSDPNNNACFVSSHPLPCWGKQVQTLAANAAEGKVNQSNIAAGDNPISGEALKTGQFAEFGINLADAGIIPAGTCSDFHQVVWESRASGSSFVSTTKDVVIDNNTISNCGEIKIIKHTDPRGINQRFDFTSANDKLPATDTGGVACAGTSDDGISATGAFCLNDSGNTTADNAANTVDVSNVFPGTYVVTEGANPTGFTLDSISCSGGTTTVDKANRKVTIVVAANDVVTCTFTNKQATGAIKITKNSVKTTGSPPAPVPLSGAHFSVCTNNGPYGTGNACVPAKSGSGDLVTAGSAGTTCIDGLAFGDYYVTETQAPSGYAKDDSTTTKVTVDNAATCADTTYVGESKTYTDTPLTNISAHAESQATGGTASRITCVNASAANVGNSPKPSGTTFGDPVTVTATGLVPGTYTCTIIIDP